MASPLSTSKIISQLKKFGVTYREYPGWKTRGRPGTFAPNGFMVHHTGGGSGSSSYLKFLFETGRPAEGIPGPLCQFAVDADGIVHIGAAGRANHAGKGSSSTLSKVQNESYSGFTSEIKPGPDSIDGNARYYGVEVIYTGGKPMTAKQYRSTVLLAAAIVDAYGWSALSVIGHREHSSRKWDPGATPMDRFRRDVRDALRAVPVSGGTSGGGGVSIPTAPSTPTPDITPKEWWEMPIPDSELQRIARAVLGYVNTTTGKSYATMIRELYSYGGAPQENQVSGGTLRPRTFWQKAHLYAYNAMKRSGAAEEALTGSIESPATGNPLSPRTVWKNTYDRAHESRNLLKALAPLVEAAAGGSALTAAQVKEIADACAAAIPADIAEKTVDELKARL